MQRAAVAGRWAVEPERQQRAGQAKRWGLRAWRGPPAGVPEPPVWRRQGLPGEQAGRWAVEPERQQRAGQAERWGLRVWRRQGLPGAAQGLRAWRQLQERAPPGGPGLQLEQPVWPGV